MRAVAALFVAAGICVCAALRLNGPEVSVLAAPSTEARVSNADDEAMQQQIVAKEREGLDALKAGNVQRFGELTADDALLVDAAGAASKTQVLANVNGFTLTDYSMENVQFLRLGEHRTYLLQNHRIGKLSRQAVCRACVCIVGLGGAA
jgi:hypothetical protein